MRKLLDSPHFWVKLHKWSFFTWLAATVPIMLFLRDNIALISFMSVYAILEAQVTAWQSARAELAVNGAMSEDTKPPMDTTMQTFDVPYKVMSVIDTFEGDWTAEQIDAGEADAARTDTQITEAWFENIDGEPVEITDPERIAELEAKIAPDG